MPSDERVSQAPSSATLDAKLDIVILRQEDHSRLLEKLYDEREERRRLDEQLRKLTAKVASNALAMAAARVASAVVPSFRNIAIVASASFCGGVVGTIAWQMWHASSAFASP